ncbi:MAG: rhodanese-like domain-containing protein [Trueperaceae bacterium]|nr:rhodanese-like domain-containing protein [Trueperaceae bacterium]
MTNPYGFEDIDPNELQRRLDAGDATVIDVREEFEYAQGHIPGATLIPLGEIPSRVDEIPDDAILVCRTGARSGNACAWLATQGKANLANLDGGTMAWTMEGYDVE